MRNFHKGLLGMMGIWTTMAVMPLAQILPLNPFQLMILRGAPALIIFTLLGKWVKPDKITLLLSGFYCLATLSLFQAIKHWGTNLSVVMLDMAVLVNFIFAIKRKEKVAPTTYGAFAVAIVGSTLAMRAWTEQVQVAGLLWSLLALVTNGLFIEYASKSTQSSSTKTMWQSLSLVLLGTLMLGGQNLISTEQPTTQIIFGTCTGLLNFLFAFIAFKNLKPTQSGILVLGVTPAVILGSYLILGKTFGVDQIIGVSFILGSCFVISKSLK